MKIIIIIIMIITIFPRKWVSIVYNLARWTTIINNYSLKAPQKLIHRSAHCSSCEPIIGAVSNHIGYVLLGNRTCSHQTESCTLWQSSQYEVSYPSWPRVQQLFLLPPPSRGHSITLYYNFNFLNYIILDPLSKDLLIGNFNDFCAVLPQNLYWPRS